MAKSVRASRSSGGHPRTPAAYTLRNGLRVVLAPDDRSPVASFAMWVKVGSADERNEEAGLAHVLEHMLFKGTETRGVGAIAQEIEGCGGDINAYTSFDTTVYYTTLASRFFDNGLDVIVDAVTRPAIDANELAMEKEVILEEIKRDGDQPGRKVSHALFRAAYAKHPYGKPVIGRRELVAGFDRPTVRGFYEKWYVPSNMLFVIAGDFELGDAKEKVERALAHFAGPKPPKRVRTPEPVQEGMRGESLVEDISDVHFEAAFHIPALASPQTPALDALAIALGQGDRSRLPWRVRRGKRLVTGVSAYAFTPADPGLFFVSASVPTATAEAGAIEVMRETFRVLREPVNEEELTRAKISIEGDTVYERETVQGIARKLGFYEAVAGGLDREKKYLDAIKHLEPKDLRKAAENWLHPDNLTVATIGPAASVPAFARLRAAAYDVWEDAVRSPRAATRRAKEHPKHVPAPRAKGPKKDKRPEERLVLPGGMALIVRREPAVPLISFRGVFLGGLRFEQDETNGLTHMLARVHCKGTADRSFAEIARAMDRFAGGVSGFSGFNSFGVRMDALSRHFGEAAELFCDILQRPTFEQREVEHERTQVLEAIKSLEDHPASWVMRTFTKTLYQRHPYRLPMMGDADRIAKVTSADLSAFYERLAVPANLSISVVGDVDTDEVVDRFQEGLAGFGGGRSFVVPNVPPEPPIETPREVMLSKQDKEQAHIALGFQGVSFTDPARYALELIASAMSGQGGRLFMELRDKQALAYSVTAFSQEALDPGYFCVYMATDGKKLGKAIEGIKLEVEKLRRDGLTAEELERTKRQIVGSFEIDLQRAAARAANLAFNDRYGLGYREYLEYPGKVLAVTRDEIIEAARRFLDPQRSVLAVVRPEAEAAEVTTVH